MSSRAILGLASIGGLVLSMALPAVAQTTTNTNTNTNTTTTTTQPATTPNCQPANPNTNPNGTTASGAGTSGNGNTPSSGTPNNVGASTAGAKGNTTNGTGNCSNTAPAGTMQNAPAAEPMTGTSNYNALTNNPNGPDWMAKFNRPNVRSNNYLGTTTHPGSMHRMRMMQHCRYVMERGAKTRICK